MNLKKTALVSGTLLATLSLSANAALITGDVGFGGEYSPLASEGGAEVDLGEAGYIDVTNNEAVVTTGGTGDLSGLTAFGTVVDYNGFAIGEAPEDPLWSGGGFEFALTGMNVIEQTDTVLGLSGEGSTAGFLHAYGRYENVSPCQTPGDTPACFPLSY